MKSKELMTPGRASLMCGALLIVAVLMYWLGKQDGMEDSYSKCVEYSVRNATQVSINTCKKNAGKGGIMLGKDMIPKIIHLPCGSRAFFDHDSGISYRCETCFSVVGSIGQPSECTEIANKYKVLEALGSKVTWDYLKGEEEIAE